MSGQRPVIMIERANSLGVINGSICEKSPVIISRSTNRAISGQMIQKSARPSVRECIEMR